MRTKNEVSRMTIDIPSKSHKQLKAVSVILGKSMREMVIESIDDYLHSVKLPNKKTLKAIKDCEEGADCFEAKDFQDLFKKLGI
jgi:antitoxin component of RelBE/YafQ-DinJ toxin-antitoxin module